MYDTVERMAEVPIKTDAAGHTVFLKEVASPKDASTIQTNVVRVDGRRQVYIPVYRQSGDSTLSVVDTLKGNLPDMKERLTIPDVDLKVVMDQSVYVRKAIESLTEEGVLGVEDHWRASRQCHPPRDLACHRIAVRPPRVQGHCPWASRARRAVADLGHAPVAAD
jgi:AcrB/AcrD/AcrF family